SAARGLIARSYGSGRLLLTDQQRKRRWPRALCKSSAPGGLGAPAPAPGGNSRVGGTRGRPRRSPASTPDASQFSRPARPAIAGSSGAARTVPDGDRTPQGRPQRAAQRPEAARSHVSSRPLTTLITRDRCPPLLGSASALARVAG